MSPSFLALFCGLAATWATIAIEIFVYGVGTTACLSLDLYHLWQCYGPIFLDELA